jgi:hypothetical protein
LSISVIMPVYIGHEWAVHLTEFAIKMLRSCTKIPFELVVAEVGSEHFKGIADVHIKTETLGRYYQDFNQAIDKSSGEFVVHTGNDVIVQPNWLEALIEPFQKLPDCGVTSLAAAEGGGGFVGPQTPMDLICETVYAPLMMFRREWQFDEQYPGMYGDSDLVMRNYAVGKRAYMNCKVVIYHFHGATTKTSLNAEKVAHERDVGLSLFRSRWAQSPYLISRMILQGGAQWGREYQC